MRVLVEGSGGSAGWPEPGCRCASCRRQALAGNARGRSAILVDGVLRLGVRGPGRTAAAPGYRVEQVKDARVAGELGGWEVTGPDGGRLLYPARPGAVPVPPEGAAGYDIAFVDVLGDAAQLGLLRARGLVGAGTVVAAAFADHRVTSERELERRCGFWGVELIGDGEAVHAQCSGERRSGERRSEAGRDGPWRVLVLGGARSGKSERAELRLAAEADVTYVAAGGPATGDSAAADPEWAARVAAHRARRPAWWRTVETTDLAGVLGGAGGALLIDGIGTWLAAVMSECGAWDGSVASAGRLAGRVTDLIGAWRQNEARVVAVSDETGLGVVPATPAGRRFRDELGRLNQALAAESEETELVVAGRVIALPEP